MSKLLDFVHRHKRLLGLLVVFAAGGLRALEYHGAADVLLYFGALSGLGYLPNGPGYAPISKR